MTAPADAPPAGDGGALLRRVVAAAGTVLLLALIALPIDGAGLPRAARFAGRLHPLVLHLPIGLLAGLFALECAARLRRLSGLDAACGLLLWLAAASATASAAAGVLLAAEGGYAAALIVPHRWLGGATAALCLWLLALRPPAAGAAARGRAAAYGGLLLSTLGVLGAAGHYGASLTHGAGYLARYWPFGAGSGDGGAESPAAPAAPVEEQDLFADVVQPLLVRRCGACHGPAKQKADLRLDSYVAVMLGSAYDDVVRPGDPEASPLIAVLRLPEEHDDHMPPSGKPQATPAEVEVLAWWVARGAPASGRIGELEPSPELLAALRAVTAEPAAASARDAAPGAAAAEEPEDPGPPPDFRTEVEPLLRAYCFECHAVDEPKGEFRLDRLDPGLAAPSDVEGWRAALAELSAGDMPPRKAPQPARAERRTIERWLEAALGARQGTPGN